MRFVACGCHYKYGLVLGISGSVYLGYVVDQMLRCDTGCDTGFRKTWGHLDWSDLNIGWI